MSITNASTVREQEWPQQRQGHPFDYDEDAPSPAAVIASINEICQGWHAWTSDEGHVYATTCTRYAGVTVDGETPEEVTLRIAEVNMARVA